MFAGFSALSQHVVVFSEDLLCWLIKIGIGFISTGTNVDILWLCFNEAVFVLISLLNCGVRL